MSSESQQRETVEQHIVKRYENGTLHRTDLIFSALDATVHSARVVIVEKFEQRPLLWWSRRCSQVGTFDLVSGLVEKVFEKVLPPRLGAF